MVMRTMQIRLQPHTYHSLERLGKLHNKPTVEVIREILELNFQNYKEILNGQKIIENNLKVHERRLTKLEEQMNNEIDETD